MNQHHYPFRLEKLDYDYSALEPYIDTETMIVHHTKHLKKYIENLNNVLANYPKYHHMTLVQIIKMLRYFPFEVQDKVRNNAGGVLNHIMYFDILKKTKLEDMPSPLKRAIISDFGTVDIFLKKFQNCALEVFGSGYTFLVMDKYKNLSLINTKNQDTPLLIGKYPILLIDVWEHAYYLKHKNKREDYIKDFIKVINWNRVNEYYENLLTMFE